MSPASNVKELHVACEPWLPTSAVGYLYTLISLLHREDICQVETLGFPDIGTIRRLPGIWKVSWRDSCLPDPASSIDWHRTITGLKHLYVQCLPSSKLFGLSIIHGNLHSFVLWIYSVVCSVWFRSIILSWRNLTPTWDCWSWYRVTIQSFFISNMLLLVAPDDLELRLFRSETCTALQQYPEALEDLEMLCAQEPEECEVSLAGAREALHRRTWADDTDKG